MINIIIPSRYIVNKTIVIEDIKSHLANNYQISPPYNLNIIFVGRRKMREIALKYKKQLNTYPVLSFSYIKNQQSDNSTDDDLIGEIFICYPQAVLLAAEKEKTVNQIIIYLIKHGIDNIFTK